MAKKFRKKDFLRGTKEVPIIETPVIEKPKPVEEKPVVIVEEPVEEKPKHVPKPKNIKQFYEQKYKLLLIIPVILLLLAIAQISFQQITTGDFVNKGISLSGGISLTIYNDVDLNINDFENQLRSEYSENDINARKLSKNGIILGYIIEADVDGSESDKVDEFVEYTLKEFPKKITKSDYSLEVMGSSLGESFFQEAFKVLYIAFLFMGMVVFMLFGTSLIYKIVSVFLSLTASMFMFMGKGPVTTIIAYVIGIYLIYIYFKNSIPSIAVILAAASDIVVTVAIFNLFGMKLSTAGVAAFLMLIGYSVDTDILLSTKVLKTKQGTITSRIYEAMRTGLMMNFTTLAALTVALFFTDSEVIRQIMTILIIGLLVDLVNTWIQNVGLLKWYLEK